jgi:hypothetical protein
MSTTVTIGDTAEQDTAITEAVFCDYNAGNETPLASVNDVTQAHKDTYAKRLVARAVNKHEDREHASTPHRTSFV